MSNEGANPVPPRPPPSVRVCAHSLVLVTGAKQCARCKGVWYETREAQKAHWSVHKAVCADPAASVAAAARLSLAAAAAKLRECIGRLAQQRDFSVGTDLARCCCASRFGSMPARPTCAAR
jgi:hypothetical protein